MNETSLSSTILQYSPGQGADGLTNPTKDPFPICNAVPVKTEEFLPYPGTIAGYESNTDCEEQPCTCADMDYSLWESRQWGEDCSYQMWKPQCDATGDNNMSRQKYIKSLSQECSLRSRSRVTQSRTTPPTGGAPPPRVSECQAGRRT